MKSKRPKRRLQRPQRKRTTPNLRQQRTTIKATLKRLWQAFDKWKNEDRKAARALLRKLRTLQRSLSKKEKRR
jgi:hypothetical protein